MANEIKEINDLISSADGEEGCIPNGRLAPIMRCTIENKALLSAKGALYVGTGTTNQKVVNYGEGSSETWEIPKTEALNPPMTTDDASIIAEDYVLTTTNEPGHNGLKWVAPQRYYVPFTNSIEWKQNSGPDAEAGTWCVSSRPLPIDASRVSVEVWRVNGTQGGADYNYELVSAPVYFVPSQNAQEEYRNRVFVYSNATFQGYMLITAWNNFYNQLPPWQ